MKYLTLNVHSLSEENEEEKQRALAEFLLRERPYAVALQEVCQTRTASAVAEPPRGVHLLGEDVPLREDNFLLGLSARLEGEYDVLYLPVKIGYGIRDEGLALLCRFPIGEARQICLTPDRAYEDWRRRCALAVSPHGSEEWVVCLHTSWWEEGFLSEWRRLSDALRHARSVWLMGDFNVSARRMEREGDPLRDEGYFDAFSLAREKDSLEDTVRTDADGWRERTAADGLRIDGIFCRPSRPIRAYRRVFDGRSEPILSDHFGVLVESEEDEYGRSNS